jgi:hypothetical protein
LRAQRNRAIAAAARELVAAVGARTELRDVNRIVVGHDYVHIVFIDDSSWPIVEWRDTKT